MIGRAAWVGMFVRIGRLRLVVADGRAVEALGRTVRASVPTAEDIVVGVPFAVQAVAIARSLVDVEFVKKRYMAADELAKADRVVGIVVLDVGNDASGLERLDVAAVDAAGMGADAKMLLVEG
ncbi:hypothetical protein HDV00_006298 [Rhizophlyctis rosea]|nr:hypothetical protein HDV00_006298 [Rhizophlyctis rosea]